MEKISIDSPKSPSKKKARWSKSIEINGITKSLTVKEVENGFIVEQSTYGRDSTKKDSEYMDDCKTYVTKTNPLEGKEADKDENNDPFTLKGLDVLIID
jgi:hypothetical protein